MNPNDVATPLNDAVQRAGAATQGQKRALRTRAQVIDAVIACLDRYGYAETSINAIQQEAGLSRGSMTHHFPTRQDMIFAATEQMLDNALTGVEHSFERMRRAAAGASTDEIVQGFWHSIVNTPQGRAFIEVLNASRTNAELKAKLSQSTRDWDERVAALMRATYGERAEQMSDIWDVSRTYLRGLLIHTHVTTDATLLEHKIGIFARMIGQQIQDALAGYPAKGA